MVFTTTTGCDNWCWEDAQKIQHLAPTDVDDTLRLTGHVLFYITTRSSQCMSSWQQGSNSVSRLPSFCLAENEATQGSVYLAPGDSLASRPRAGCRIRAVLGCGATVQATRRYLYGANLACQLSSGWGRLSMRGTEYRHRVKGREPWHAKDGSACFTRRVIQDATISFCHCSFWRSKICELLFFVCLPSLGVTLSWWIPVWPFGSVVGLI